MIKTIKILKDYKLVLEFHKCNTFSTEIKIKEDNIILDDNILNILDSKKEFIYIIPLSKYIDILNKKDKEIEILKENAIHNDKVVNKAKWNEMLYKSRNEKAIELIHKAMVEADITGNGTFDLNELLKILKGE